MPDCQLCLFFFFNDTATTEIYTLSLHDALPIFTCPIWSSFFALTPLLKRDFGYCFSYVPRSMSLSGEVHGSLRLVGSGSLRETLYFLTISYSLRPMRTLAPTC